MMKSFFEHGRYWCVMVFKTKISIMSKILSIEKFVCGVVIEGNRQT